MQPLALFVLVSFAASASDASLRAPIAERARPFDARAAPLVLGPLAWRAGDVIESSRRLANDLEVTCLVDGKLQQRFVRSEESEARVRTRLAAVTDGRIERVGVRYELLVERSMQPEELGSDGTSAGRAELDALVEARDALEGRAVELALEHGGSHARNEDGTALERGLAEAVRSKELSRAGDLDTGVRALERWLSARRFEPGALVRVPEFVSLELLRGETLHQASTLELALVPSQPGDAEGSARLRLAWHLAWTADEPGQELSADLAGHVLVERATARVLYLSASGDVAVAGAAQAGDALVEYAGRGRLQLVETRAFARE
ncbi:MAG: hypothetical protein IPJ77_08620 [Planctomycetes bacterium]|nr:hypothetical protein [Planctomycetota bacterium]